MIEGQVCPHRFQVFLQFKKWWIVSPFTDSLTLTEIWWAANDSGIEMRERVETLPAAHWIIFSLWSVTGATKQRFFVRLRTILYFWLFFRIFDMIRIFASHNEAMTNCMEKGMTNRKPGFNARGGTVGCGAVGAIVSSSFSSYGGGGGAEGTTCACAQIDIKVLE